MQLLIIINNKVIIFHIFIILYIGINWINWRKLFLIYFSSFKVSYTLKILHLEKIFSIVILYKLRNIIIFYYIIKISKKQIILQRKSKFYTYIA